MFNNKKFDFNGKVALITGSSSGIGAAIAMQFAQYGCKVTIHGRDVPRLNEVGKRIKLKTQHEPLKIIGDLLDPKVAIKLIDETINRYGKLDFLINNAGGASPYDDLDNEKLMEAYEEIFGLNIRCIIHLTQKAMPYLIKTKGSIVNISSIASIKPYFPLYSSAKTALDMFTKSSAQHLGPKGVRVNAINPGPVLTRFARNVGVNINDSQQMRFMEESLKELSLLNRVAYPDEIANLASFLVSSDAANITGSIIVSDTGCLVKKELAKLKED